MQKIALVFLLLTSTVCFGQTCDPMATAQEAKIKTEEIDANYEKQFEALALELQQKSGMSDEEIAEAKIAAVLNEDVMSEQRDTQADLMAMMTAIAQKDCAKIKELADLNHTRAIKQWEISIKNLEKEITRYK